MFALTNAPGSLLGNFSRILVHRKYPKMGDIDHHFVAHDWLTHVGLSQYAFTFETQMIDGRLLSSMTRKDIEKYLNITSKFHQVNFLSLRIQVQLESLMKYRTSFRIFN